MKAALRDLPHWPAALNHDEAIAYTRLSDAELRRHEKQGNIHFLPFGTKGEKICPRADLDGLLCAHKWEDTDRTIVRTYGSTAICRCVHCGKIRSFKA